ncbi:hypothetical protein ETB97_000476 [Aspergillus alliaceus]|uniref:Uncharacterized protein n=1 Tax=Petromyces alliaceus TaxID=209559 RepID=A0A8H6A3L6_PETAA|nr:hypothetical protein ETB97_000476 [Aspergillus burnettii]
MPESTVVPSSQHAVPAEEGAKINIWNPHIDISTGELQSSEVGSARKQYIWQA